MHEPPKLTKADREDQDIEFHEDDENFIEDDVEEVKPEVKDRNFEFTSNVNIMRFMRAIFYLQVIALAIDNPSIDIPPLFRILVNGVCFYSLRFYSRPFIDFVYAAQYYYGLVAAVFLPYLPSKDATDGFQWDITTDVPLSTRRLLAGTNGTDTSIMSKVTSTLYNVAVSVLTPTYPIERFQTHDDSHRVLKETSFKLSVLFEQHWHATKFFSYFFFSLFFTVMAVLYTFQMWEIKDYTDLGEVQTWLRVYIADGWINRGGARLAWSITQGCVSMFLFMWFLYAIANEVYSYGAIPANLHISTVLGIYFSILIIIWTIGYRGFKATEGAFIRYVSQNVTYTSTILLKRVVKAKTEVGLALMFLLYMPSLYFFSQSLVVILDWNDTIAMTHRNSVNFYVPCYYYAFPPYRHTQRHADTCDVSDSVESVWLDANPGKYGFYKDERVVSCDSYFGVTMYTIGFLCTVMLFSAYGWLFYEMIDLVAGEFRKSRWVESFEVLRAKTFIENLRYKVSSVFVILKIYYFFFFLSFFCPFLDAVCLCLF